MKPSDRRTASRRGPDLQQLTPVQRTIVELLSVFCDSEPLTSITRALSRAGVRIDDRSPRNDDVRASLDALARRGVLVAGGGPFSVSPELAHVTMLEIGRETVYGEASDALLAETADELVREAMGGKWS